MDRHSAAFHADHLTFRGAFRVSQAKLPDSIHYTRFCGTWREGARSRGPANALWVLVSALLGWSACGSVCPLSPPKARCASPSRRKFTSSISRNSSSICRSNPLGGLHEGETQGTDTFSAPVYVNAIRLRFVNRVSRSLSMVNPGHSLASGMTDTGRDCFSSPGTISST